MVVLSLLGLVIRLKSRPGGLSFKFGAHLKLFWKWTWKKRNNARGSSQHKIRMHAHRALTPTYVDIEAAIPLGSTTGATWGDIQAVRRQQQEVYTARLRLRVRSER